MATVDEVMRELHSIARPDQLGGMARYGITVDRALGGIPVPYLRSMAKRLRPDHSLALALWRTGVHEARILASMVDDPARVTERQMESWARAFDSWDVCDQVCMNLFDRTPFAWAKAEAWTTRDEDFVKRAGFALIASLAAHAKAEPDERFAALLPVVEAAATDGRNFVKKAVSWALRQIGKRNAALHPEAVAVAERLAGSPSTAARWVGRDALRELRSDAVMARLAR